MEDIDIVEMLIKEEPCCMSIDNFADPLKNGCAVETSPIETADVIFKEDSSEDPLAALFSIVPQVIQRRRCRSRKTKKPKLKIQHKPQHTKKKQLILSEEEISELAKRKEPRLRKALETYITLQQRRLYQAERVRAFRAKETNEQKEARRLKQRIALMKRRLMEQLTMSQEEIIVKRTEISKKRRQMRALQRATETPTEAAERKTRAQYLRQRRFATETAEEKAARREAQKIYKRSKIATETPEQKELRMKRMRFYIKENTKKTSSKEKLVRQPRRYRKKPQKSPSHDEDFYRQFLGADKAKDKVLTTTNMPVHLETVEEAINFTDSKTNVSILINQKNT